MAPRRRLVLRRKRALPSFQGIAHSSQHGVNSNIFSIFSVRYHPQCSQTSARIAGHRVARHSRAHLVLWFVQIQWPSWQGRRMNDCAKPAPARARRFVSANSLRRRVNGTGEWGRAADRGCRGKLTGQPDEGRVQDECPGIVQVDLFATCGMIFSLAKEAGYSYSPPPTKKRCNDPHADRSVRGPEPISGVGRCTCARAAMCSRPQTACIPGAEREPGSRSE